MVQQFINRRALVSHWVRCASEGRGIHVHIAALPAFVFLAGCGSDSADPADAASGGMNAGLGASASPGLGSGAAVITGATSTPGFGGSGAVGSVAAGGQSTGAGASTAMGGASTGVGGSVSTGGTASVTGGAPTVDVFSLPPTCTSGTFWTTGESETMRPGEACVSCHATQRDAPTFAVAGTLYPTGHEPNDCNGAGPQTGAVVVITDAQGTEHRLNVNQAGNFILEGVTLALPYTAKVVIGAAERAMSGAQTSGDCNSCHTEQGASSAPGRIALP